MPTRNLVSWLALVVVASCGTPVVEQVANRTTATIATSSSSPTTSPALSTTVVATTDQEATAMPNDDRPTPKDPLDAAVEAAKAALAGDLGIDPSGIEVVTAEAIRWPDASLGCPEPGAIYAQAITPGAHIVLKASGASYSYHGVEGGIPIVCTTPQIPPPIR